MRSATLSPAYLIVRYVSRADIRQLGSGNAGTANVNRVLGTRAALVVFFIDILKGALAVWVGQWIGGAWGGIFAGLAVVLGHNYPALLGFRGGEGAADNRRVRNAGFFTSGILFHPGRIHPAE